MNLITVAHPGRQQIHSLQAWWQATETRVEFQSGAPLRVNLVKHEHGGERDNSTEEKSNRIANVTEDQLDGQIVDTKATTNPREQTVDGS